MKRSKKQHSAPSAVPANIAEMAKATVIRIVAILTKGYDVLRESFGSVTALIRSDAVIALEVSPAAMREYADNLEANTPEGVARTTVGANASNLRRLAAHCEKSEENRAAVLAAMREGGKLQTICKNLKVPAINKNGRKKGGKAGAPKDSRSAAEILCETYDALDGNAKREVLAHILSRHVGKVADPKVRVSIAQGFEQLMKVA